MADTRRPWAPRAGAASSAALLALLIAGCSVRQMAVNALGDALAEGGGVYASDGDPDLVREAIPFGLKTIEGLLAQSPDHEGMLLAAASGFAGYAFLLQQEAAFIEAKDPDESRRLRVRASALFLRGRDYALRGLDLRHVGFGALVREDPGTALAATTLEDAALLYWAGAAWAGALGADNRNLDLLAELSTAAALVDRVLELDERYDDGAAHEFFVSYEAGRPGGDMATARAHFARALDLSGGKRASVYLALAEGVAVQEQNLPEFRALVAAALAVDPESTPELRLVNTLARRRAEWLEARIPDHFFDLDQGEPSS
ncbi:MAG: TRAP transporter TatT component family protein [Alphaproteobacteria bacterium]